MCTCLCVCMSIYMSVHAQCEVQRSNFATPRLLPETGSLCCSMPSKPALLTHEPLRTLRSLSPMPLSEHRDYRHVSPCLLFTWCPGCLSSASTYPFSQVSSTAYSFPPHALSLLLFCLSPSLLPPYTRKLFPLSPYCVSLPHTFAVGPCLP